MRPAPIAAMLLLVAAVPVLARDREVPAATPTGEPQLCLDTFQIRESLVRSDQVIDFVTRGRQVYRNTLDQACPRLGIEQRFTYQTTISRLCASDIITVLNTTPLLSQGAACGLGKFQPVTLTARR